MCIWAVLTKPKSPFVCVSEWGHQVWFIKFRKKRKSCVFHNTSYTVSCPPSSPPSSPPTHHLFLLYWSCLSSFFLLHIFEGVLEAVTERRTGLFFGEVVFRSSSTESSLLGWASLLYELLVTRVGLFHPFVEVLAFFFPVESAAVLRTETLVKAAYLPTWT